MTAGTSDGAAAVEVKTKDHAQTAHMDEPAVKIDTANGDLSAPPPLQPAKGTTHAENGVAQPAGESRAAATLVAESAAVYQPVLLPSPVGGRLSSDDSSGVLVIAHSPPLTAAPVSTPDLAAASLAAAPSPAMSPAIAAAAGVSWAAGAISSPPALVSTPPALVSAPAAARMPPAPPAVPLPAASPASAATSPAARKRSAEAAVNSAEPAARQPRRGSSDRQPETQSVPHRTVEMIESSLLKLKREVKAIDLLARQKEREWDNLLRLRRAKEETFQRLRRKREVLMQQPAEAARAALAAAVQPSAAPAVLAPAPRLASSILTAPAAAAPTCSVSSAMWALKQQHEQQRKQQQQAQQHQQQQRFQQQHQQQQQQQQHQLAQQQVAAAQYTPRATVAAFPSRPLRPVPVPPPFVGAAVSSAARLPQPARVAPPEPQEPQYREILAQVARLNQRLAGSAADQAAADAAASAAAAAAHHSSLAKLLMEKKIEPGVPEMLKPQIPVRPSVNGPRQVRPAAPLPAAPRPPPPPPPASATEVPLCQGCGRRQAQFVCAGCGHQWYCSRDCQVEAWDSHADNCSG